MPVTIGIAGDSATGKTTLATLIKDKIFIGDAIVIEGDGYHKWARGDKHWQKYTHLNPRANFLDKQVKDIDNLKKLRNIERVEYNHSTGCFTEPITVYPSKFIVVNGLHTLYLPQMRNKLDFKIYMEADTNLRVFWKLQRDSNDRNQNVYKILSDISMRENDFNKYILPQSNYADMIITYFDNDIKNEDVFNATYEPHIGIKVTFDIGINIMRLINIFYNNGVYVEHDLLKDINKQKVVFYYHNFYCAKIPFENIVSDAIPNIYNIGVKSFDIDDNVEMVLNIMFLYILNEKIKVL